MRRRNHSTIITAVIALLIWGVPVHAQQGSSTCADKLLELSAKHSLPLAELEKRLSPADIAPAVALSQCDAPDLGLPSIVEKAIRIHDSIQPPSDHARVLYVSPSVTLEIGGVPKGVPEDEIIAEVRKTAPGWTPPKSLAWEQLLAEMNALTHELEAQVALQDAKQLNRSAAGVQLATLLLAAGAYLDRAINVHVDVYADLTANGSSMDGFRILWERAELALKKLAEKTEPPRKVIAAAQSFQPALKTAASKARVRSPAMDLSLGGTAEAAGADDEAEKKRPPSLYPEYDEPGSVKAFVETTGDIPPPQSPDAGTPGNTAPDAGAGASADNVPDDKAKAPAGSPGAEITKEEIPWKWIAIGTAALAPWLWVFVLWVLRRFRNQAHYLRAANRSLAMATILVVFVSLGMGLGIAASKVELVFGVWTLAILWPFYFFGVIVFMLSRMDSNGELAGLRLMRTWGKWGAALGVVLSTANAIMMAFFGPLAHFVLIPSLAIVAIFAIVFLLKLWRTGNVTTPAEGDTEQPNPPQPPEVPAPQTSPPPVPATPPPVPVEDNPLAAMSDEDFADALAAMDGAGDSDGEPPEDRAELYKLLDE